MDLRLARLALHNEALTPPEQADIGGNAWSFVPVAVALPPQAGDGGQIAHHVPSLL